MKNHLLMIWIYLGAFVGVIIVAFILTGISERSNKRRTHTPYGNFDDDYFYLRDRKL